MSVIIPDPIEGSQAWQELQVLRQQTVDFIQANPINISMQRMDTASDGAGGVTLQQTTLATQTFRLISLGTGGGAVERRTVDGQMVFPDFVLLGEYTANLQNGDVFFIDGIKYEIVYVRLDRRYELWGEVSYRG